MIFGEMERADDVVLYLGVIFIYTYNILRGYDVGRNCEVNLDKIVK